MSVPKPPKATARRAAALGERLLKIQAGLASQDKKLADYKKTLPAKPKKGGLLPFIKKNAWEKD